MTGNGRSSRAVLGWASAAQASVSLVNFGLPAIGPQLSDEFDMSLFWLGAVLTAGLLGSGLALIMAGVAVDRLGARRAMLLGTALATLGLVAAAFAPTRRPSSWRSWCSAWARRSPRWRVRERCSSPTRRPDGAGPWACARPQFRSAGRSPLSRTPPSSRSAASSWRCSARRWSWQPPARRSRSSRGTTADRRSTASGARSARSSRLRGSRCCSRSRPATSSCCRRCSRTSSPPSARRVTRS